MKTIFRETYFMAAKCCKANFLGGYMALSTVRTLEDSKPLDAEESFESILAEFRDRFEGKGLDTANIEVTAFNRV